MTSKKPFHNSANIIFTKINNSDKVNLAPVYNASEKFIFKQLDASNNTASDLLSEANKRSPLSGFIYQKKSSNTIIKELPENTSIASIDGNLSPTYHQFLSTFGSEAEQLLEKLHSYENVSYPLECWYYVDHLLTGSSYYRVTASIYKNSQFFIYFFDDSGEKFDLQLSTCDKETSLFNLNSEEEGSEISFLYEQRLCQQGTVTETEEHYIYFYSTECFNTNVLFVFDTNYTMFGQDSSFVNAPVLSQEACREHFCELLTQLLDMQADTLLSTNLQCDTQTKDCRIINKQNTRQIPLL